MDMYHVKSEPLFLNNRLEFLLHIYYLYDTYPSTGKNLDDNI